MGVIISNLSPEQMEDAARLLARAFVSRGRYLAAIGAAAEARAVGVALEALEPVMEQARQALGEPYEKWRLTLEPEPG